MLPACVVSLVCPGCAMSDRLTPYAVRWSFNPGTLAEGLVEQVRPLVSDANATSWVLRAAERQRLIRAAGSLEALRVARGREAITGLRQEVLDRILAGPPYPLAEIPDAKLPYWLQAVRWFSELLPDLPAPLSISRAMERRRQRTLIHNLVGSELRGREQELTALRAWYLQSSPGPLLITGIGGVGKTALVAQFAAELPDSTPLLWLDFDRADLAPDDAVSVLRLLYEQLAAYADNLEAPSLTAETWRQDAIRLGEALAGYHLPSTPLLVLDGFEVAQQVLQYQEIWRLLEQLIAGQPNLHVIVSGRAPVPDLRLGGNTVQLITLTGIDRASAATWLRAAGISDTPVLTRVLDLAAGIPLALKLTVRLIERGGAITDLPAQLPRALFEGIVFTRILERVGTPALAQVARDALVLRLITPQLIAAVLHDSLPPEQDAQAIFSGMASEIGLVDVDLVNVSPGATIVLRLRPEVRAAALKLLELNSPDRVRSIDERATVWYANQDLREPVNRAELIYHRLRLSNIVGAAQVWRDTCAPLLLYAEDELPQAATEARRWLRERLQQVPVPPFDLRSWELGAVERIRGALARGLHRIVPAILAEYDQRSPGSPLMLYDAWIDLRNGAERRARMTLRAMIRAADPAGRNAGVLSALVAIRSAKVSDRFLASVEEPQRWQQVEPSGSGTTDADLRSLVVRAARLRLTVNLRAELELQELLAQANILERVAPLLRSMLSPADVLLPTLAQRLSASRSGLEPKNYAESARLRPIRIPRLQVELPGFAKRVEGRRREMLDEPLLPFSLSADVSRLQSQTGPWGADDLSMPLAADVLWDKQAARAVWLMRELAVLAWRRWRLLTSDRWLAEVVNAAAQVGTPATIVEPLLLSVVATTVVVRQSHFFPDLAFLVEAALLQPNLVLETPINSARAMIAAELLLGDSPIDDIHLDSIKRLRSGVPGQLAVLHLRDLFSAVQKPDLRAVLLYLLGPDPLEMLVRRTLGLPASFEI